MKLIKLSVPTINESGKWRTRRRVKRRIWNLRIQMEREYEGIFKYFFQRKYTKLIPNRKNAMVKYVMNWITSSMYVNKEDRDLKTRSYSALQAVKKKDAAPIAIEAGTANLSAASKSLTENPIGDKEKDVVE